MIYHVGFYLQNDVAHVEACKSVDFLSCETIEYFGRRITTKKDLMAKAKEQGFLTMLQQFTSKQINKVVID
jgi:hypothetical protein